MSDLSNLFAYDQPTAIKIKNPVTGEDVGITIYARSFESEVVTRVVNNLQAKRVRGAAGGDQVEYSDFIEEMERESLIAAIVRWDFGDNSFGHLSAESPCDLDNKRFLITHPNAKWIRDQIRLAIEDIGNFTNPSKKPARPTSKK